MCRTSVSLEGGDQAAAVLLQLQDGHLTRLVSDEGVPGLHVKPGIRLRLKKTCKSAVGGLADAATDNS